MASDRSGSEAAAARALQLARAAGGERDSETWIREGEALLAGTPPR